jgi:tRNA (guanine37-N1)-methyltransferase
MITFHIVSIFPETVENYTKFSILKRAKEKGFVDFKFYNIRDYSKDKHRKVDDKPYAGGPGMVMNAEPILLCVKEILEKTDKKKTKIINFIPGGEKWTNTKAKTFAKKFTDIIMICGRYEGIDYRIQKILKSEKISIGDYVLTGGEIPAMVLIDSISRQVKGVLGDFNSLEENRKDELENIFDSDEEVYTRPEILEWADKNGKVKKHKVPKVFLSGNHKLIREYRQKK